MNFLFVAITLKFKNGLGFFVWINKECEYYYNYFIRIYSLYNIAKICLKVQIHCTFIYVFRFICILIYIFIPKLKVLWIHCILLLYKSTYMVGLKISYITSQQSTYMPVLYFEYAMDT